LIHSNSHIEECLRLIEAQWRRGPCEEWSSYDFEKLNEAILAATGVSLSVSTLKRVFGKVAYSNLPSTHTLNTLARFAGYEDWNDFRRRYTAAAPPKPPKPPTPPTPPASPTPAQTFPSAPRPGPASRSRLLRWWPALLLPLAILLYSLLNRRNPAPPAAGSRAYSFRSNKVLSQGVPNSVVFHYHTPVAPTDSVFIVQTWDLRRRARVPANGSDYSAIYYYPGFFRAKLLVDTQIVRTHDLMIGSDGWLAAADQDPIPVYFKKEEIARNEGVEVDSAILSRYHLDGLPTAPMVRLFNMKDMGGLSNADFTFETTLRTGYADGSGKCQYVQVLIQCKDDIIIIPLAAKACIGALELYFAGAGVTSATADLSGFGCDLTQWTNLRVVSNHRNVRIFVNDKPACSLHFPDGPTDIVGVQYRFSGPCAVKNARFSSGNRVFDLK